MVSTPVSVHVVLCFVLLGVYGDVQRVKILFNKKDNALVQMAEPHHAQLGKLSHFRSISGHSIILNTFHRPLQTPNEVCFLSLSLSAKTYLDKLTLYGKQIRVAPSKHTVVQMPKEGQQVANIYLLALMDFF